MIDLLLASPRRLAASAGLALALLAGCGGGTSTVDPFIAERVLVFGDESGLLVPSGADKGRRWGINGLTDADVFDCRLNPTWAQTLAATYGLHFEACPYTAGADITQPGNVTVFKASARAAENATAADLAAQVTAQLDDTSAGGGITDRDMAAVMVGTHDLVAVYEAMVDRGEYSLSGAKRELDRRGALVAAQVNRLAELGARVLVTTVPRLDHTPYGRARRAGNGSQGDIQRELSDAFNARLRRDILQDGSKIGLVMADDLVLAIMRSPANYSLSSDGATVPACNVTPLPSCTIDTLVDDAADRLNLWADPLHLGPVGHRQLARQFVARAVNNPF